MPQIHVVAAGSLLEKYADKNFSFPVGRVEYLAMRPCSFREFLVAVGESVLRGFIENDPEKSIRLTSQNTIIHHARIITYVDVKKRKLIQLPTSDMGSDPDEIIAIYRQRWEIELLFKQNFPLKYFYGECANAIKIQIWVTLIANLLLVVMQRGLMRSWSFSGLATMVGITLMYYGDFYSLACPIILKKTGKSYLN